jgi:hypothetical protein
VRKEDTIFRAVGTEDIDQQLMAISEHDSGHEIDYDEVFWHSLLFHSITIQQTFS